MAILEDVFRNALKKNTKTITSDIIINPDKAIWKYGENRIVVADGE